MQKSRQIRNDELLRELEQAIQSEDHLSDELYGIDTELEKFAMKLYQRERKKQSRKWKVG